MITPHTGGRVYVREPYAGAILRGEKRIETAHIRLPERFAQVWLDLQTEDRTAHGRVRFRGHIQWHTVDAFDADVRRHRVEPGSPYHFANRRATFGWVVDAVEVYRQPKPMPPMNSQFRLELY